MKIKKNQKKSFYKGRFLPRLITLVIVVMGLTALSVFALMEAVDIVNNRYVKAGQIDPNVTIFLIFASALILGTLITIASSGLFLRPIRTLEEAMDKVSKGDFNVELDGDNVTQIGRLMNNFNKMTHDLSQIETFKNEFIGNVSHEFKTPLSVIQGYAMLLQNEDLSDEERESYLNIIIDTTKTLSNMTSNILKLSKLENSKIIGEITTIDLSEQIRRCVLGLESSWSEKNLTIDVDLAEEIFVNANEDLLYQVWTNLLSNAIKFTDEGGIFIRSFIEDEQAVVKITDTGIGMSEEVKARIFDKFYQGDNSHSKEGNGLGLALTKRIVESSFGTIDVESEEKVGSTFIVRLPLSKK